MTVESMLAKAKEKVKDIIVEVPKFDDYSIVKYGDSYGIITSSYKHGPNFEDDSFYYSVTDIDSEGEPFGSSIWIKEEYIELISQDTVLGRALIIYHQNLYA